MEDFISLHASLLVFGGLDIFIVFVFLYLKYKKTFGSVKIIFHLRFMKSQKKQKPPKTAITIKAPIHKALVDFCKQRGMFIGFVAESAVSEWIERNKK